MTTSDIDALHYKKNSSFQFKLAEEILNLHSFLKDDQILDVGSGDGKLTAKLAEKVPQGTVLGIDPSEKMIQLAQNSFPKNKFPNLRFKKSSAEHLEFKEKFHLITAFSSLHWVRGQETALKKMYEALLPEGKLLVLTFPKTSLYFQMLEEVIQTKKWQFYTNSSACRHWVTPKGYEQIAHQLNLKVEILHTSSEIATYQNPLHFKDYVKGWLPCLISLPKELQEEFLNDLSDRAIFLYGSSTQLEFNIPYEKTVLYATKTT